MKNARPLGEPDCSSAVQGCQAHSRYRRRPRCCPVIHIIRTGQVTCLRRGLHMFRQHRNCPACGVRDRDLGEFSRHELYQSPGSPPYPRYVRMIGELNPCAASELSHACHEKEKRGCASPADVTQISKEAASRIPRWIGRCHPSKAVR